MAQRTIPIAFDKPLNREDLAAILIDYCWPAMVEIDWQAGQPIIRDTGKSHLGTGGDDA